MAVMVSSYGLQVPFGNTNTFIRSVVGCLSVLMFLKLTQKLLPLQKKAFARWQSLGLKKLKKCMLCPRVTERSRQRK